MKNIIVLALAILYQVNVYAQNENPLTSVIINSHPDTKNYVASPSIAKLPNGDYIASHDWQKSDCTSIYISKDKGRIWSHLSDVPNMHWANLFVHNDTLYIMGVNKSFKDIHICRSADNGKTWTTPTDNNTGIIFTDGQYHTAPVPVIKHDGRIWRSFENAIDKPNDRIFETLVISADENLDILKASSWQMTNKILYDRNWGGKEWIEGNIVIAPDGKLVNILRNESDNGRRAVIVSIDNQTAISFTPSSFIDFPGGSVKFTIRYDSISQRYWSLTNYIPIEYMRKRFNDPAGIRNTLALTSSSDLKDWTVNKIIFQTDDLKNDGFQYADWFIEDNDLVAVIRTAYIQPDGTKANNFHNANYITSHRIENFRDELCNDIEVQSGDEDVYLFSYFINNGEDGLHLAYSYNGLRWKPLKNGKSFLQPAVGNDKLMRDPSICMGGDSIFHMVWTPGWHDRIIGYASSEDLINWSTQKTIPVMSHEPTARNSWAPELFFDPADSVYHMLWSSTIPGRHSPVKYSEKEQGYNHRIYQTSTKDFISFTKTELFFNPDFSVIDAAILKNEDKYIMFLKNENPNPAEKNIRYTISTTMDETFPLDVSEPITGNYWAEGPSPLQIGEYTYVYFDKYIEGRYGAVRSKNLIDWEDVSDQVVFPVGTRHGTAFKVKLKLLNKLFKETIDNQ